MRKSTTTCSMYVLMCVVLAAFTLSVQSVYAADPTPCDPCRWTNDAWSAETGYDVLLTTHCRATIYYKTRKCINDGCNEVKIDRIVFSDSCDRRQINQNAEESRLGTIFYDFVKNNPMSFPPVTKGASSCWRFVMPRCWRYGDPPCLGEPSYSEPKLVLLPCDTDDCCVSQVVVLKDACEELQIFEYPLDEDMASLTGFIDMYDRTKTCSECPPAVEGYPEIINCANYCSKLLYEGLIEISQ